MPRKSTFTRTIVPLLVLISVTLPFDLGMRGGLDGYVSEAYAADQRLEELHNNGLRAMLAKDYASSLEFYLQAVSIEPSVGRYTSIGSCLNQLNRPSEAITYLDIALGIDKYYSATYIVMAHSYELLGDYRKAKELAKKSFELHKSNNEKLQPQFIKTYERIMAY